MTNIKVKLHKDSIRLHLTTPSGYTIDKEHWEEVNDEDITIKTYFMNRDDILIQDKIESVSDDAQKSEEKKSEEKAEKKAKKEALAKFNKEQEDQAKFVGELKAKEEVELKTEDTQIEADKVSDFEF